MTKQKNRPPRRWAALLAAAVLLGAAVTAAVLVPGRRPLARIGNSPVGEEEFLLVLRENLVQYETALRQNGTLPEGQTLHDFVQADAGADAVLELQWQQLALQRAKCSLAVEYGVAGEYSFAELKHRMNEENSSRIARLESGEPVYGLRQFDLAQFYGHWMATLETDTVAAMQEAGEAPGEQEIQRYYQSMTSPFGIEGEVMHYTVYDLTGLSAEAQQAAWQQAADQPADAAGPLSAEGKEILPERRELDDRALRGFVYSTSIGEELLALETGQTAPLLEADGRVLAVRFDNFEHAATLTAAARSTLQSQLLHIRYAQLAKEKAGEAPIQPRPAARSVLRGAV